MSEIAIIIFIILSHHHHYHSCHHYNKTQTKSSHHYQFYYYSPWNCFLASTLLLQMLSPSGTTYLNVETSRNQRQTNKWLGRRRQTGLQQNQSSIEGPCNRLPVINGLINLFLIEHCQGTYSYKVYVHTYYIINGERERPGWHLINCISIGIIILLLGTPKQQT